MHCGGSSLSGQQGSVAVRLFLAPGLEKSVAIDIALRQNYFKLGKRA
jgi:hypothetical protein